MKIHVPSTSINDSGKIYDYHQYNRYIQHLDTIINVAKSAPSPTTSSGYTDLLKGPRSNVAPQKPPRATPLGQIQPPTLDQLNDLKTQHFSYE